MGNKINLIQCQEGFHSLGNGTQVTNQQIWDEDWLDLTIEGTL